MGLKSRKSFKMTPDIRNHTSSKPVGVTSSLKGLRNSVYSRFEARKPEAGQALENRSMKTRANHQYNVSFDSQKGHARYNELEKAKSAVEAFENTLERIHSIHHKANDPVNWHEVRDSAPPYNKPKGEIGPLETEALKQLNEYKPNLLSRLLGRYGKKLQALKENVYRSRDIDILDYQSWMRDVRIAAKVIAGDADTYFRIIKEFAPFDDLLELGSVLTFSAVNPKVMEIEIEMDSEKIVPKEQFSLTHTGKLATMKIPKNKFFDLQQDYVCNCVIRIAREMFALLPLEAVFIHAADTVRNTTAGIDENQTILSVRVDKNTLNELNFDRIVCQDTLHIFTHHIHFNKTSGFHEVSKLSASETEIISAK